jgi:hypothetical protein
MVMYSQMIQESATGMEKEMVIASPNIQLRYLSVKQKPAYLVMFIYK